MDGERSGRRDDELVASLVGGDETALGELYDRYGDAAYRVAFRWLGDRQLAEDVMQEAFLVLWNRAELFDPRIGSLAAWLSTITRNRSVDRLRALGRRPPTLPLSAVFDAAEGDDRAVERTLAAGTLLAHGARAVDPEQVVDEAALRDVVRGALGAIPELERRVIELAYYEDLTQSEIAARLGWPLGTVKTRTRRALALLRAALADRLEPEWASRVRPLPAVPESQTGAPEPATVPRKAEVGVPDGPH